MTKISRCVMFPSKNGRLKNGASLSGLSSSRISSPSKTYRSHKSNTTRNFKKKPENNTSSNFLALVTENTQNNNNNNDNNNSMEEPLSPTSTEIESRSISSNSRCSPINLPFDEDQTIELNTSKTISKQSVIRRKIDKNLDCDTETDNDYPDNNNLNSSCLSKNHLLTNVNKFDALSTFPNFKESLTKEVKPATKVAL